MLTVGLAMLLFSGVLFGYAHGYQKGKAEGSDLLNHNLPAWTVETDEHQP